MSAFSAFTAYVSAEDVIYCNGTIGSCPEDKPCCSQYGTCGTGLTCLGGCNPMYSYNLSACMPVPVCKDSKTIFNNYSSEVVPRYSYLGDADKHDWTYEGSLADLDEEASFGHGYA